MGPYLWWWLLPAQQWADGDNDGEDPDAEHGKQRSLLCDDRGVLQWPANPDVAVDGDNTQGHDGGRAAQDVHRSPDVAEDPTKNPVIQDLQQRNQKQNLRVSQHRDFQDVFFFFIYDATVYFLFSFIIRTFVQ